ncbi:MAG TPA: hypothetical protein VGM15_09205 [Burkholderiaceae bacterium]|jgi:hypothetical protein
MHQQVVASSRAAREDESRDTARRVLQQLFDIDPAAINESWTLADFEGCNLPEVTEPLTSTGWRIRVRDRVFTCFGVTCDIDEPLSDLAARIDRAERGVRCTLGH